MPTSVHIPKPLLAALDRRAKTLKVSRNRVIVQALERELTRGSQWSPGFLAEFESTESGVAAAADEMLKAIRKHRTSKKPVAL
jgi:predicted transcriptional regulator